MAPFHSDLASSYASSPGPMRVPAKPAIPPIVSIGAAWAADDLRAIEFELGPVRLRAREAPMARVHAIPAIRHDLRAASRGAPR